MRLDSVLLDIAHLRLAIAGTPVLHDVSLRVEAGEIVGLLGPNGAGKTTTMLAALGLLRPAAGEIRLVGCNPWTDGPALRRHVGVLPDPNGFYDWMTAPAYLAFFAKLYGTAMEDEAVTRRLAEVGLEPRPGQTIGTFSHGMRQRLGLARALLADPVLLMLDEPTSGLDPRGRGELHDVLARFVSRGTGVLLCTHLLDDVERLCGRVCILAEGRTRVQGRIAELLSTGASRKRFRVELASAPPGGWDTGPARVVAHDVTWAVLELDPSVAPEAAWRELIIRGWPIATITRVGGGLEEFYFNMVQPGDTGEQTMRGAA